MITMRAAALEDCLDFAGGRAMMRKYLIHMQMTGEAVAIEDDGALIAVAFLTPAGAGRREFCLGISSRARARMRELCRAAHLILNRMAEDQAIICHIVPGNRSGARMARIVGFRPDPDHRYRWIMERGFDHLQEYVRGRCRQTGGRSPAAAGGEH